MKHVCLSESQSFKDGEYLFGYDSQSDTMILIGPVEDDGEKEMWKRLYTIELGTFTLMTDVQRILSPAVCICGYSGLVLCRQRFRH